MDIMITTVWHSGTHSLQKYLENQDRRVTMSHCSRKSHLQVSRGDFEPYTTIRDPYRVLASWKNRDRLDVHSRIWYEQWMYWARVVPMAKVFKTEDFPSKKNTKPDKYGVHQMLNEGDYESFHSLLPIEFIEFAYEMITKVSDYLPSLNYPTGEIHV